MSSTRYCGYCSFKIEWQSSKRLAACPRCKKEFNFGIKCSICTSYVNANRPYCNTCGGKRDKLLPGELKARAEEQKKKNIEKLIAEGLLVSPTSKPIREEYGVATPRTTYGDVTLTTSNGVATPSTYVEFTTPSTTCGVVTPSTSASYSSLIGFDGKTSDDEMFETFVKSGLSSKIENKQLEAPDAITEDTLENEAEETSNKRSTRRRVYERQIKKKRKLNI